MYIDKVKKLQEMMQKAGFYEGAIDGDPGKLTRVAAVKFLYHNYMNLSIEDAPFKRGARGFIVGMLQRALKIEDDEVYGGDTETAVKAVQHLLGVPATGKAGRQVFEALDLVWPDNFAKCMQVVAMFEGTGFGGVNNTDIDGAGITLGLAGFTSKHGEVQILIPEYFKLKPSAINDVPKSLQPQFRKALGTTKRNVWDDLFYSKGKIRPGIKAAVKKWGEDKLFQNLQLITIRKRYWEPAERNAKKLGITSLQGFGLMLDIHVQNGGWRAAHEARFNKKKHGTEKERLIAMAEAVSESAIKRWRKDVLDRKMTYATGSGTVHKRDYDLSNYGFKLLT